MARKRMIDPNTWTSEDFGTLSDLAQIYWIGVISNADDEGRIKASPAFLKANIRPYSSDTLEDVKEVLLELTGKGMVCLYEAEGNEYGYLPKWFDYQKISHPTKSKIPKPPKPSDNPPEDSGSFRKAPPQYSLDEVKENLEESNTHPTEGSNSCTEETAETKDPKPSECEVSEETQVLAKQIHRKLSLELAPLQGFHLTRLEFYRSQMSDNDILAEVLGASTWIANKNRSWDGILSIVKKRVDNPPKTKSNGIHAPPEEPEMLSDEEKSFEASYQRVSDRITAELGISVSHMGKPGHRGGITVYGAKDGDLSEKAKSICREEGLPDLELEVL